MHAYADMHACKDLYLDQQRIIIEDGVVDVHREFWGLLPHRAVLILRRSHFSPIVFEKLCEVDLRCCHRVSCIRSCHATVAPQAEQEQDHAWE